MSTYRPQEPYEEREHSEPFVDEGDHSATQEGDHSEHVEDEKDAAPDREAEQPGATATPLPVSEGAGQVSTASEQLTVLEDRDAGAVPTPAASPRSAHGDFQIFGPGELEGYRSRWESIQFGFLDDPKGAAEQADTVVRELLGRLTERHQLLSDELNRQSDQDVDTESMRLAVRNYRSLFQRLAGS